MVSVGEDMTTGNERASVRTMRMCLLVIRDSKRARHPRAELPYYTSLLHICLFVAIAI